MLSTSVITWSLALSLILLLVMSIFSSFADSAELLNTQMAKFPEELRMAFGMDNMDLSTVLGFYSIAFLLCQICLAIQAANYGFSLLSVEERDMTADFLLAKPVGRTKILTSKFLAALTGLTITNLVIWLSSFVFINLYRDGRTFEIKPLLLLLGSIVVFQLFFLTVGMLISLLVRRVRSVTPYSMALGFGMYVLSAFGSMLGDDNLEMITPFKHFEPNQIITNAAYDPLLFVSVAVVLISIAGSYVLYIRRDIHSVV
ncbi:MAG: ABC transporter permease [Anaerolineales bacterium]|nr:ABC transporter permease [Anaerolineales bacterium]